MKKIVCIVLALVMLLALAACGGSGSGSASASDTPNASGSGADTSATVPTLTTVNPGKLTMSTSPDFPPYESTDDAGNIIGIDPEILSAVAAKLGLELQIDAMDFDSALLAVQQGKADVVAAGVTVTEDRMLVMDFADSYTTAVQVVVVPVGSDITLDNLGEQSIGVQRGTTGQIYTEDDYGAEHVLAYDTYASVIQALLNGQIDCIVMDNEPAKAYVAASAGKLAILDTEYSSEEYAFGVTKGNTDLLNAINAALKELTADGTIPGIINKYISSDDNSGSAVELTTVNAGKLTISSSPDFPPFEYTDDNGNIIGIEPELMELICRKIGLELQIDAMDFDSALLAAQQGKSDAVVSGVTVTEDRKVVMDFTDSYTTITQAIVSKEGSGITMDNLGEYRIGVQRGTTGHIYTEDDFGTNSVIAYDTYTLVFQALNNDQVDCIVMDDAVAAAYLATNPGLTMTSTTYEAEEYAFGFHKGNTDLVNAVNAALNELIADGTVQSIIDKYMSE